MLKSDSSLLSRGFVTYFGVVPYLRGQFQWVAFFPFGNTNWNANVFNVNASGKIDDNNVNNTNGLRPASYYD